jgi:hypothetical protein
VTRRLVIGRVDVVLTVHDPVDAEGGGIEVLAEEPSGFATLWAGVVGGSGTCRIADSQGGSYAATYHIVGEGECEVPFVADGDLTGAAYDSKAVCETYELA